MNVLSDYGNICTRRSFLAAGAVVFGAAALGRGAEEIGRAHV